MSVPMSMPILVVDDYNIMVRIVRNLLRQLGFQNVDEASDGKTALAKLSARAYGLVISDWKFAPKLGDAQERETPVLVLTQAEGNDEARGDEARATLAAPFDAAALKTRLTKLLGEDF